MGNPRGSKAETQGVRGCEPGGMWPGKGTGGVTPHITQLCGPCVYNTNCLASAAAPPGTICPEQRPGLSCVSFQPALQEHKEEGGRGEMWH